MKRGLYFSFQGFIAIILVLLALSVVTFSVQSSQPTYSLAFYYSLDGALTSFYLKDETFVIDPTTTSSLIANQSCSPVATWNQYDLQFQSNKAVCVS